MKINSNTAYPYPIWGWKDDYKVPWPEYEPIAESDNSDKENHVFELKLKSIHPDVKKLLGEGKAINACIVDCPSTYYHDIATSSDESVIVIVPRNKVNKRVEFKWMILSTAEVDDFVSSDLNEDYDGGTSFPIGAMIAYVTSFEINADVCDAPHSIDDIFAVVKNIGGHDIEYDFSKDKIRILIPEKELDAYRARAYRFPHIILSTVVYRALVSAISKLPDIPEQLDWVYIVKQFIDSIDDGSVPSPDDCDYQYALDECFKIADKMLQSPFLGMFEEINSVESHNYNA